MLSGLDEALAAKWERLWKWHLGALLGTVGGLALALLFPMETLFESYIAALVRRQLDPYRFTVSAQDKRFHLFDEPHGQFQMRPDLVITRKQDSAVFVMDTKWKLLAEGKANYGIAQADMYQMYAYQKKYAGYSGRRKNRSSIT